MGKRSIDNPGAKTYGPYSAGIIANGIVWLSGQIAPEAGDDIQAQTAASLAKIDVLLTTANLTRDAVCFAQILLADIDDFAAMNEVYGAWVDAIEVKPARAAFAAAGLPANARIEIVIQAIDNNS
jgi:2-iminobutanoate/2-iminopropanoate deaminase